MKKRYIAIVSLLMPLLYSPFAAAQSAVTGLPPTQNVCCVLGQSSWVTTYSVCSGRGGSSYTFHSPYYWEGSDC